MILAHRVHARDIELATIDEQIGPLVKAAMTLVHQADAAMYEAKRAARAARDQLADSHGGGFSG